MQPVKQAVEVAGLFIAGLYVLSALIYPLEGPHSSVEPWWAGSLSGLTAAAAIIVGLFMARTESWKWGYAVFLTGLVAYPLALYPGGLYQGAQ